jgi:DNA-binding NtrC family response regulator
MRLLDEVKSAARVPLPALIVGESGSGKELVARSLHDGGARALKPFVAINCAAIPEALLERELFGATRGAFTGADRDHPGLFRQADGGTVFLDEIGDMPVPLQAKLLRVLQEGAVRAVGALEERPIDVRVIAATHRDLEALVRKNVFREDLYHRIFVFPITIPPLRDRIDDVPLLAEHFAALVAEQNGWKHRSFPPEALDQLAHYPWPGNVRELRNVVERLLLLTDDAVDAATVRQVLAGRLSGGGAAVSSGSLGDRVTAFEREGVLAELGAHNHRVAETARALGLERSHLYKKCQQLGIDLKAERGQT